MGFTYYLPFDVTSVAAFASKDDSRPALSGVSVNVAKHRVEAADGFRLSWMNLDANTFPDEAYSHIIPANALTDVVAMGKSKNARLAGIEVDVLPEHGVRLTVEGRNGRVSLTTSLVDAQFPDVSSLIPTSSPEMYSIIDPTFLATTAKAMLNKENGGVFMGITGQTGPIQFVGDAPGGTRFNSIVMPKVSGDTDHIEWGGRVDEEQVNVETGEIVESSEQE